MDASSGTAESRVRCRVIHQRPPEAVETVEAKEEAKGREGQGARLLRNMGVAASLVVCAALLRAGPQIYAREDAVLTAASGKPLLSEQLGRLSFVSAVFPRATLVFGESGEGALAMPVMSASVEHLWSREEPYTTWRTKETTVLASMDGEVRGVYHANGGELLVHLGADDGTVCVYGNLQKVYVQSGDAVRAGEKLGEIKQGEQLAFEVRVDGYSVNPASMLPGAS